MRHIMLRFPGFKQRAVTISYDDGVIFDERLIEIMDKNGLKGTFNLNSGIFGKGKLRLSEEQSLELYAGSGHEVAAHGKMHLSLSEVQDSVAVYEVISDRAALEEMFGTMITGFAYANGSFDDKVASILKLCGFEYARTIVKTEKFDLPNDFMQWAPTCHHSHPQLMDLARKFIEEDTYLYYWAMAPKLFYLWGHSYEYNDNNNWNVFEEFAEYIGNRENVWYATNIEICHYVKAFRALQFSANGEKVYNPTATDVYLNYFKNEILVKAGETVNLK